MIPKRKPVLVVAVLSVAGCAALLGCSSSGATSLSAGSGGADSNGSGGLGAGGTPGGSATGGTQAGAGASSVGQGGSTASGAGASSLGAGASGRAGAGQGGAVSSAGSTSGGAAGVSAGGAPSAGTSAAGAASGGAPSGGSSAGGAAQGGSGSGGNGGDFLVCTGATKNAAVSIYFIGDSTVSVYDSSLYPRMGWGQPLGELFSSCGTVKDKALSGRSSKSFYDEGDWTPVRDALKSGDYVLIEFGHNDEKSDDPLRYTDPETTFKQYLTSYITDARAKQAIPVLITPINRNDWSGTTLQDTHGQYPPAMRELAQSLGVPLIDLTALTKQYFERIGQTETTKLFMDLAVGQFPNYPTGNTDNTHLQDIGAHRIGLLAMSDAYERKLTLASLLKAAVAAP